MRLRNGEYDEETIAEAKRKLAMWKEAREESKAMQERLVKK